MKKAGQKAHILKAGSDVQKRLKELDKEMRSLRFKGNDGKHYLPRMAIVEDKLSPSGQLLAQKMASKLDMTLQEATDFLRS